MKALSSSPLTAEEIYKKLKGDSVDIDLASVYRTLELFIKFGVIKELFFNDSIKRYEIIDHNDHHHHLICTECGSIEDIALSLEKKFIKEIKNKSKFKVEKHSLEFFGICRKCQ